MVNVFILVFCILIMGHVNVLQLQMVLHNYEHVITQLLISFMESPIRHIVYLHELFSASFLMMKQPSSEEWHIAVGSYPLEMHVFHLKCK
jgi:hypothetical protein